VLECLVPSNGAAGFAPNIDSTITHVEEIHVHRARSSIFAQTVEDDLQEVDPEVHSTLTSSIFGYLVQGVLVIMAILAYVGNPILVTWCKTVGQKEDGAAIKVSTYSEVVMVLLVKCSIVVIGLVYALVLDFSGARKLEHFWMLFDMKGLQRWLWVALGWTLADVAEQMAMGRIGPATYTVLSQSRLIGTALVMRLVLGTKRSQAQWNILLTLCLVIIGWKMIPNVFGEPPKQTETQLLGLACTVIKMVLSIGCGVCGQSYLQQAENVPFVLVQAQICLAGAIWMFVMTPFFMLWLYPEVLDQPWWDEKGIAGFYGFFGGVPYNGEPTGWNIKTLVVFFFGVYRDFATNMILRIFDALVKNLCNAVATAVAYYAAVFVLHDIPFNPVKGLFSIVITLEIVSYGLAQASPQPKNIEETK
jgi:hypothetical protein